MNENAMFDVVSVSLDCYILFRCCRGCFFDKKFMFFLNFMFAYDHIIFPFFYLFLYIWFMLLCWLIISSLMFSSFRYCFLKWSVLCNILFLYVPIRVLILSVVWRLLIFDVWRYSLRCWVNLVTMCMFDVGVVCSIVYFIVVEVYCYQ